MTNPEPPRPHFFQFLTREEFLLCFALAFIDTKAVEYRHAFGLDRFASPCEPNARTYDWTEEIMRACRFLAMEHDFEFQAIDCFESGRISNKRPPVQPENQVYVWMLGMGRIPHVANAIEVAIGMAEERLPKLDADILRGALADVRRTLAELPPLTPEELEAIEELREFDREALAQWGVVALTAPKEIM